MAKYALSTLSSATAQSMTTTPGKTLLSITAATGATTLRRAWLYDLTVGTDGTPADNAMVFYVNRQTSASTGTADTPAPLDFGDAACLTVGTVNYTIEPIQALATGHLLTIPMNQRASYRWVAAPGGELIMPAVNVAGLGVRVYSPAYTGTSEATIHFWE